PHGDGEGVGDPDLGRPQLAQPELDGRLRPEEEEGEPLGLGPVLQGGHPETEEDAEAGPWGDGREGPLGPGQVRGVDAAVAEAEAGAVPRRGRLARRTVPAHPPGLVSAEAAPTLRSEEHTSELQSR